MEAKETIFLASSVVYWPRKEIYPLFCQLHSFHLSVICISIPSPSLANFTALDVFKFDFLSFQFRILSSLVWNSSGFGFQNLHPVLASPKYCPWDAARMQTFFMNPKPSSRLSVLSVRHRYSQMTELLSSSPLSFSTLTYVLADF